MQLPHPQMTPSIIGPETVSLLEKTLKLACFLHTKYAVWHYNESPLGMHSVNFSFF